MKKLIFLFVIFLCIAGAAFSQLYISSGAGFILAGNAQVALQNMDLVNDGNLSIQANGRFIFSGSNNNVIAGSQNTVFSELEINKSGTGSLTLQQDIQVKNKIIFTSNLIELNQHTIELGTTGYLEGENENSRITGINGGEVLAESTINAPAGLNTANLGVEFTSSQNLGVTTIHRGHQSQINGSGAGSSIYRYFDINPTNNSGLNVTLRFNYFDAEKNGLDENNFDLYKSADHVHWRNMGQQNRNVTLNYVEQVNLNDFSRWTLSTTATALPVTGLRLSGKWKNNTSYLNWITISEFNNSHFNIERRYKDETDFISIGRKNSAYPDGNSQTPTNYSWTDAANAGRGPIEYRVRQQDLDGNHTYSNTILIVPETSAGFIINLYPTLSVKDQIYIQTGNRNVHKMQISIFDRKGSLVVNEELSYQSQWLSLPFLSGGIYEILISSGELHWNGRFMKP